MKKHIVYGGRGKCKMMAWKEFIKHLPKDIQENSIVVRVSDKPPKLRGNKLPRIVDYDMMESKEFSWELWDRMFPSLKNKRTTK